MASLSLGALVSGMLRRRFRPASRPVAQHP